MNLSEKLAQVSDKEVPKLRLENAKLANRIKDLENALSFYERQTKSKIAFRRPAKQSASKFWHRVIVPDSHGCKISPAAASAFLADLESFSPREVIWIGDHLDCGGFLAEHHTLGYVAETEYSYAQDVASANDFLDQVQKRTPKASHYYLFGNHEGRIESWCVTMGKRGADSAFLKSHLGADAVLNLTKRGMQVVERNQIYNTRLPGTIKLGHCYFTHGSSTASHAASVMLSLFAGNVVFGHTHRIDMLIKRLVSADCIAASVGCLSELQPTWRHTSPTTWSHGYGVQTVHQSGEFLHVTVPIIDGKSYLGPFLGK